uniref:Large proline-rich protein bag6 isoform x9 n=1 Tax=Triatoma infestans TaxID=30076 RepID=A0A170ZR38_TRIIF
MFLSRRII